MKYIKYQKRGAILDLFFQEIGLLWGGWVGTVLDEHSDCIIIVHADNDDGDIL